MMHPRVCFVVKALEVKRKESDVKRKEKDVYSLDLKLKERQAATEDKSKAIDKL